MIRPQEWPQGPFSRYPQLKLPSTYILTKTHCGGFCDDCAPRDFVLSLDDFGRECGRTAFTPPDSEKVRMHYYSPSLSKKAVHLIRNPFDNLFARIHMAVDKRTRRTELGWTSEQLEKFDTSRDGYLRWCQHVDTAHAENYRNTPLIGANVKEAFVGLPCFSEWFRFTQWHNHAFALTQQLALPTHVVHYEDYQNDHQATTRRLLDFLQAFPARNTSSGVDVRFRAPLHFDGVNKTYQDFYTRDEMVRAKDLVYVLASNVTWSHLERYFGDLKDDK